MSPAVPNPNPTATPSSGVASLAQRIDALLPQTQCTRCGYPDCRAYAEAVASGAAPLNQCPPGGAEGIRLLAALLTVEGELDDISGSGQTKAAHDLCTGIPSGRQFHYEAMGAGHYGIFSGRRWREKVYPQVRDFILRFQTERLGADAAPAAAPAPRVAAPARKARVAKAATAPRAAVATAKTRKPRTTAAARKTGAATKG